MGILLAFLGFGIWSLVVKSLATGMVQCGIYWLGNKWRPEWVFSWKSFTGLFRYGSFMFLNSIANSLYYSALSLIIGRCFSSVELGYYSQANKLQDVPRNSISSVVTNVTFLFSLTFRRIGQSCEMLFKVYTLCCIHPVSDNHGSDNYGTSVGGSFVYG